MAMGGIAMYKKCICILFAVLLVCGLLTVPALAARASDSGRTERIAAELKTLGLFRGVSDTDFALDRAPTRSEAIVMLVRLLGKETAAFEMHYSHPFTDVPVWADPYVGYAYRNGLTKGISADKLGDDDVTCAMFLTFVLRALGYQEGENGDFTWDDPYAAAAKVGIVSGDVSVEKFTRGDVVKISWCALHAVEKDTEQTLGAGLVSAGAITEKALEDADTVLSDIPFIKVTWDHDRRCFAEKMTDDADETLPSVDENEPIPVPTDPTLQDK